MRTWAVVGMAAVLGVVGAGETAWGAEGGKRPNVVIVMGDQWRAQATGYAGDPNVKTPNLDRLEKGSVNFVNAVSSNPVCSPCRASILTGQRSTKHGIFLNDAHLSDDAVTLAKVMREAGYDTGIIGKWHLNGKGRLSFIPRENRQGFDYWKVMECTHAYNHSEYYADGPEKLEWAGYDAFAQTADAEGYIKEHAKGTKPFMLCLWWGPPHNPFGTAPKEYKAMYEAEKIQLRPNVPEVYRDAARKDAAGYYAHISALDKCVGDLWGTLKEAGVEDDTIVLFTSDHGEMLYSGGFNRKQKPWDESVRVPMLWHYPKALQGKRVEVPMATEDVMPTVLGLCGVAVPKSVQGMDYSGYMKGGENPNKENAAMIECVWPFAEWSRALGAKEYRGVRTTRYTYVKDLKGPWLLYDNEVDPYQMKNLVGDAEAEKVRTEMEGILQKKLEGFGDAFKPGEYYVEKWGYKGSLGKNGALSTEP